MSPALTRSIDLARRAWGAVMAHLSVKLTLLYGAMFLGIVLLIVSGARLGIERYAERLIAAEMDRGSTAFDRIAAQRYGQLADAGRVLAGDFGFRAAAATEDRPTIASALVSLKTRLSLDEALFVDTQGNITGLDHALPATVAASLHHALDQDARHGVFDVGAERLNLVAEPVNAPSLIGWVVFGNRLGDGEMKQLASFASIDLHPRVIPEHALPPTLSITPDQANLTVERMIDGERKLVRISRVEGFGTSNGQVLVLEYSLTRALGEYTPMLWRLSLAGLLGVIAAMLGSWLIARRLTSPIKALDTAARAVSAGEYAPVTVETSDEIGRLAESFNKMVCDIEERERQISHLAFHDSLTGLANRALLREHLGMALSRLSPERPMTLLCLDLDNFKAVNDTLGHPVGDALLCEVARRLTERCGEGFVARLGGDEFAIVVAESGRAIDRLAHEILGDLSRPATVEGHRVPLGTSIGIAVAGQDGPDPVTLLKNADLALYRAKQEGKGGFRYFEVAMDAEAQARRAIELDLHEALGKGELQLMFQPLFNLSEGRISAFEALLRWVHPTRGMVSPVDFIPLAEDTGLIIPIGEWVLREACRVAQTWPDNVRVAVNVSPVQFKYSGLNAIVLQALSESGLEPNRLELEITESLFIENVETTLAQLHSLRAIGVRVALDDFGTGYSSLSYLRSFPFDKLKIDRSFIMDLLSSDGATAIIKSITSLAEALGMETTAEGVENLGQLDILRAQGCSQIQGFYFSKPVWPTDIERLFDEAKRKVA